MKDKHICSEVAYIHNILVSFYFSNKPILQVDPARRHPAPILRLILQLGTMVELSFAVPEQGTV